MDGNIFCHFLSLDYTCVQYVFYYRQKLSGISDYVKIKKKKKAAKDRRGNRNYKEIIAVVFAFAPK